MDTLTESDSLAMLDVDFDQIKPCWNPDHTAVVDAVWIASNCHMAINVCEGCRANALRRASAVLCSNCLHPADKCWRFLPIGGTP